MYLNCIKICLLQEILEKILRGILKEIDSLILNVMNSQDILCDVALFL